MNPTKMEDEFRMITITRGPPHHVACFEGRATIKAKTLALIAVASFIGSFAAAYIPHIG